MFRSQLIALTLISLLSACGGGGNGAEDDPCLDPQSLTCPTGDTDNDGILNSGDSTPNDSCLPNSFNASCNEDIDNDGESNFEETETADQDSDGIADYLEADNADADADGVSDEADPANNDPCIPDNMSAACGTTGLITRPNNSTCIAPDIDVNASANIELQRRFSGVTLDVPIKGLQAPNDSNFWYIAEKSGNIVRFANDSSANSAQVYVSTAADSSSFSDERGLLGFAFSPDWPTKKELYVSYTLENSGTKSRLSRLVITDDLSLPATYTEQVLFEISQPFSNHNGGEIAFSPIDGYLYWGLGDGGDSNDFLDKSQDTRSLLGAMVRVDVNGIPFVSNSNPANYNIPADNPFAANAKCGSADGTTGCAEIYAWGLRNPWRWSFDSLSGNLYLGDVGQSGANRREEINQINLGGNYGWPCREGFLDTSNNSSHIDCATASFDPPLHDYETALGRSVTGGYVYRGSNIASEIGNYLFADYITGRIWSLNLANFTSTELIDSPHLVSSFMQDENGELYVLRYGVSGGNQGHIYQIVDSNNTGGSNSMPTDIFDVGCIDANQTGANNQLIPYEPSAPFWSDNANKQRWLSIPNNTSISASDSFANWSFPSGTVTMKNFVIDSQLIETRFFMRHTNGDWGGYSYEWNSDETQASLVVGGKDRTINLSGGGTQIWRYPSSGECNQCHTAAAGFVLGISTPQLNGVMNYPSTGITANQLETLNHIDFFSSDVSEPVAALPALPDPFDVSETISNRARSYLHTNCSSCHRPGGGTPANIDLRLSTTLNSTMACNVVPQLGNLGISGAQIISAGNASNSVLHARMTRRDGDAMPPIGSNIIDLDGAQLIADWINSLGSCN